MLLFFGNLFSAAAAGAAPENDSGSGQVRGFVYHHFGMEDKYPSTSVSISQFKEHLEYLEKKDYTLLTLGEALDLLHSEEPVPEKTAVLTIDDAYKSVIENAVPLLEKYGYKATVFVPTRHVGGPNYMSWSQLAELRDKGFELANHSHSHEYFLNHRQEDIAKRFEKDLERSHRMFKDHLGITPDLYAYPFGEYHPDMIEVLKKYGYRAAAAQKSGVMHEQGNRFLLPRFPMNFNYGEMESFTGKIKMHALGVVESEPENPVVRDQNPPELKLLVKNEELRAGGLQCFVSGRANCETKYKRKDGTFEIRTVSTERLETRRTLYTITAPSEDGSKWFWYSYVWIMPEYSE
ncbi:MAG: polysaccharide deacetylase family protein [Desulfobacteraceae bacterium]|nr:polysaccharide deacetylase family protein [Desulfobacteraceae bacterium]